MDKLFKEEDDTARYEEYLRKLKNGIPLGISWRSILKGLYERGRITDNEQSAYTDIYSKKKETAEQQMRKKIKIDTVTIAEVKCEQCGTLINSGTYGMIFENKDDPNTAIKASIKAHAQGQQCPDIFLKEIGNYTKIESIFPRDLSIIQLLNIFPPMWVENRRCYFNMEKLLPIVLNDAQLAELEHQKDIHPELIPMLDIIKTDMQLYMLVPGILNPVIHFVEGGGSNSKWREINDPIMRVLFEILGIDIAEYYRELKRILDVAFANQIYLIDVEFILCSEMKQNEAGELVRENKIVMIDFDKVEIREGAEDPSSIIRTTITQDMFPPSLSGGKKTKKKNKKRKKSKKRN